MTKCQDMSSLHKHKNAQSFNETYKRYDKGVFYCSLRHWYQSPSRSLSSVAASNNTASRVLDQNDRVDSLQSHVSILEQHLTAMLCVFQWPNVSVNGTLASPQNCAVQFLPHGRAVPEMIFPVDIKSRELAGHCLLVRYWLRFVGIQKPLPCSHIIEGVREFGIVAGVRQPAERDHVEMAAASSGFLGSTATGRFGNVRGWARDRNIDAEENGGEDGEKR